MKGVIFYYSATGNTKLVSQYVARKSNVNFELLDIARSDVPDLSAYGLVGLASPVDWLAEPKLMRRFVESLPAQKGKPVFLLVNSGGLPGRTLRSLEARASARGFRVVAYHSIVVPDNYPPILAKGRDNSGLPSQEAVRALDDFSRRLGEIAAELGAGRDVPTVRVRLGLKDSLMPPMSRARSKKGQGPKRVNEGLCTKCGACERACPYKAIRLDPYPVFDETSCWGCWACYNRCPAKAISTKKLDGRGQYPGPTKDMRERLGT